MNECGMRKILCFIKRSYDIKKIKINILVTLKVKKNENNKNVFI